MNPTDCFLNVELRKLYLTAIMIYGICQRRTCDEVSGYKINRKCNVKNTWWWNSGVMDEIQK